MVASFWLDANINSFEHGQMMKDVGATGEDYALALKYAEGYLNTVEKVLTVGRLALIQLDKIIHHS